MNRNSLARRKTGLTSSGPYVYLARNTMRSDTRPSSARGIWSVRLPRFINIQSNLVAGQRQQSLRISPSFIPFALNGKLKPHCHPFQATMATRNACGALLVSPGPRINRAVSRCLLRFPDSTDGMSGMLICDTEYSVLCRVLSVDRE